MAKRITQIFQKDLNGNFDSTDPIKIGSSAQYITTSDNNTEKLKQRLDAIGNPDTLSVNTNLSRDSNNYKTIIAYLNDIGPKANNVNEKLNISGGVMTGSITFNISEGQTNSKNIIFGNISGGSSIIPENQPISGNIIFTNNSGNIIFNTSTNDIIFSEDFEENIKNILGDIFDEEIIP